MGLTSAVLLAIRHQWWRHISRDLRRAMFHCAGNSSRTLFRHCFISLVVMCNTFQSANKQTDTMYTLPLAMVVLSYINSSTQIQLTMVNPISLLTGSCVVDSKYIR